LLLCLRSNARTNNESQTSEVSQEDFLEFERITGEVVQVKEALKKYKE
jgi:hypothetical protein